MEARMLSFKWKHFKQSIILMAARWYLAYAISYRDIEELMAERGVKVDHSTVNRWVIEYAPQLENKFRKKYKSQVGCSWRADETYVKIKGQWHYLYRAVDKEGNTVDFYLSRNRDKATAEAFFKKAIGDNMLPEKVVIDKSGANKAALDNLNLQLALLFWMTGILMPILVRQIKYLNNRVEQDHRAIKKIINPMKGFKSFVAAKATLAGIELHHMLRKGQYANAASRAVYEQFYALAV